MDRPWITQQTTTQVINKLEKWQKHPELDIPNREKRAKARHVTNKSMQYLGHDLAPGGRKCDDYTPDGPSIDYVRRSLCIANSRVNARFW